VIDNYEEFKEYDMRAALDLSGIHKDTKNILDMTKEDFETFLANKRINAFSNKKYSVKKYLRWLNENYGVDTSDIYFMVSQIYCDDVKRKNVFFYSFDEFYRVLNDEIESAYLYQEAMGRTPDFNGVKIGFLLQWFGVTTEEFVSVQLSDVKDIGKRIYIPLSDREVLLNQKAADDVWQYKNTTKTLNWEYQQSTLLRTKKKADVTTRTLYRMKKNFFKSCKDERFYSNRIFISGLYFRLYDKELSLGRELSRQEIKQIRGNLNSGVFIEYKTYKQNMTK